MKHHFADFLDREKNYWTIIPNATRYQYTLDTEITERELVKIITIQKTDKKWRQVLDFPNLEEITLHSPSHEQVEAISTLSKIKRFRLTHYRPKNIAFIEKLENLEEVVLEYVSGFTDLTPLSKLKNLKSLYLENLRKVISFDGLMGASNLKYLHITGTIDWKQPIQNCEFLRRLPSLEVFALGFVKVQAEYPAFLSLLELTRLERLKIGLGTLQTKEYAFLIVALPDCICGAHGTDIWKPCWEFKDRIVLLGKGQRSIKKTDPNLEQKCNQFEIEFDLLKDEASSLINEM